MQRAVDHFETAGPRHTERCIEIAGQAVLRSAASKRFLDLKVLEILAKPRG